MDGVLFGELSIFTRGMGLKNFFVRILYFSTKRLFRKVEEAPESIIAEIGRDEECPCNVTGICRCWALMPCTEDETEIEGETRREESLLLT